MCSSLFLYHRAPAAANVRAGIFLLLTGPHDSLTGGIISHCGRIRIIAGRKVLPYDNGKKEVRKMFGNKYKLSYDERRIIVLCLIEMKNKLIRENRYTDAIDDLLVKFMD
jgi:hypothetical protein